MAKRVAVPRALHQSADGDPKIFTDPLALPIIGKAGERWMHEDLGCLQDSGAEAGIGELAHVRFVPVNFDEQSLGECLGEGGSGATSHRSSRGSG